MPLGSAAWMRAPSWVRARCASMTSRGRGRCRAFTPSGIARSTPTTHGGPSPEPGLIVEPDAAGGPLPCAPRCLWRNRPGHVRRGRCRDVNGGHQWQGVRSRSRRRRALSRSVGLGHPFTDADGMWGRAVAGRRVGTEPSLRRSGAGLRLAGRGALPCGGAGNCGATAVRSPLWGVIDAARRRASKVLQPSAQDVGAGGLGVGSPVGRVR